MRFGKPKERHLKRRKHDNRALLAMTIKYLVSTAELKDLHPQFGATSTAFLESSRLGMMVLVKVLIDNPKAMVVWDRSKHACSEVAKHTSRFLDIPGVVAMIDGKKLVTLAPDDIDDQNRDYNGWTKDVNRNLVIVWDPNGKIVDAAVNTPGNYHDSKSALWCKMYEHVALLPHGYKCVCDDAFYTQGELEGKMVKTKETFSEGAIPTSHDQSLTHLRQCSEWGNNVLTGVFRRLKTKLPTENIHRGYIMWCSILLHNWRTETVGRNQIKTYFNNLEKEE